MKRFTSACLALASVASCAAIAVLEARPRYGGTLRVSIQAALRTLDPLDRPSDPAGALAQARVASLVTETLVRLDDGGRFQPGLALSWRKDAQARRWEFPLRPGVTLHDGTVLVPALVAASLHRAHPEWTVTADGAAVTIEPAGPEPELLWDLAQPRCAVSSTGAGGQTVGTGPFRVERWAPGRQGVFVVHESYWNARPFLEAIQVDMGRRVADQVGDLELAKADIVAVTPGDLRRLATRGLRLVSSPAREVVALVVDRSRAGDADLGARRALALSVDRQALSTLVQHQAEPAAALLPQWASGYAFLFPAKDARTQAKGLTPALPVQSRTWRLLVDSTDPVLSLVAGRVVADARDAGLTITLVARAPGAPPPDVRLVRYPLPVASPDRALSGLVSGLGLAEGGSRAGEGRGPVSVALEATLARESALLERALVVPLLHLSELFGVGPRVAGWPGPGRTPSGAWQFEDVWLRPE